MRRASFNNNVLEALPAPLILVAARMQMTYSRSTPKLGTRGGGKILLKLARQSLPVIFGDGERKVRAPQSRMPVNGRTLRGDGKCHREWRRLEAEV
jgi:hypothetical protein